jgi:predicted nucleotidyltransferase
MFLVMAATDEEALARVRRVLAGQPVEGVVSAYVFGSTAERRSHRESDVDLGVVFDRRIQPDARHRFEAQLNLRGQLSPAAIGREIDIVVLNDVPPTLGRRVIRGEQVYCADAAQDRAFRRDVQLLAADLDIFLRRMRPLLNASLSR